MAVEIQSSVYIKAKELYSNGSDSPFVPNPTNVVPASLGELDKISTVKLQSTIAGRIETKKLQPQKIYEKISSNHGRSMTETVTSKALVWGGNLSGDIYGARSIKGTAMYQGLSLEKGGVGDYGVQGHGLMDDACIERCIRASEVLRSHGLPTEKPVSIFHLKEVIEEDSATKWEKISISKWKKLKTIDRRGSYDNYVWGEKVNKYLSETNFASLERHLQVDERIRDLEDYERNPSALKEFLTPIFKWLNVATAYTRNGLIVGTKQPEQFTTEFDSIGRYFSDFLPSQIGTYLGRMHKLGIAHGYTHDQNWSMVGTLYDLDSPTGKAIFKDDDPPVGKQYVEDFSVAISGAPARIAAALSTFNYLNQHDLGVQIRVSIARSYIKARYGSLNYITKEIFRTFYINNKNSDLTHKLRMQYIWAKI